MVIMQSTMAYFTKRHVNVRIDRDIRHHHLYLNNKLDLLPTKHRYHKTPTIQMTIRNLHNVFMKAKLILIISCIIFNEYKQQTMFSLV
jgi:hypothetical protein